MEPYGKWLRALEFNNGIRVYGQKITILQNISSLGVTFYGSLKVIRTYGEVYLIMLLCIILFY
jgi:hypothetical protein